MGLVIGSENFTWDRKTQTFSAEASDLEYFMDREGRSRLDYVNGKWGFSMRSARTGRVVWFQRVREYRDRDNDLVSVLFVADLGDRKVSLTVFND